MSSEFSSFTERPSLDTNEENERTETQKKFDTLMNATMSHCRNNMTQESLNTTPKSSLLSCVSCKSFRSVNEICRLVLSHFENFVDKESRLTKIEKSKAKFRFSEIFNKAFRENVLVDGEPCPAEGQENITSEFEAVDLEKKKLISEVLIPNLDDAILKTVNQRKNGPKICRKHWKNYTSRQMKYLSSVLIQNIPRTNEDKEILTNLEDHLKMDQTEMAHTLKAISAMSKGVVEDCGQLENLLIVKEMDFKIRNTKTYKALYEKSPPSSSSCPRRSPMKGTTTTTTPSKKARLVVDLCPDIDYLLARHVAPKFKCQ